MSEVEPYDQVDQATNDLIQAAISEPDAGQGLTEARVTYLEALKELERHQGNALNEWENDWNRVFKD